jgi:hypothetical protein
MAKQSIYRYMGATVELLLDGSGSWIAHRGTHALHTLNGWQELPNSGNWRDLNDSHCFEFADYLAAARCIAHFARLEKAAA